MAMFSTFIAWSLDRDHGVSLLGRVLPHASPLSFVGGVAIERVVITAGRASAGADGGDRHARLCLSSSTALAALDLVAGGAEPAECRSRRGRSRSAASPSRSRTWARSRVSLGAVALLWLFFRFTKLGLASRAAAVNPEASAARRRARQLDARARLGLAAALGAVSGMLTAPAVSQLDPNLMQPRAHLRVRRRRARRARQPARRGRRRAAARRADQPDRHLRRLRRHRPAAAGRARGDPAACCSSSRPASSAARR